MKKRSKDQLAYLTQLIDTNKSMKKRSKDQMTYFDSV